MKTAEIVVVARMFDEAGIGIAQAMSAPWMGVDLPPGGVERFRGPTERFAETIIAEVRG
jgi:hypothetical protein